jgi:hypothetical protein
MKKMVSNIENPGNKILGQQPNWAEPVSSSALTLGHQITYWTRLRIDLLDMTASGLSWGLFYDSNGGFKLAFGSCTELSNGVSLTSINQWRFIC